MVADDGIVTQWVKLLPKTQASPICAPGVLLQIQIPSKASEKASRVAQESDL